jgi:uncharacterized membrane protein
MIYFALLQQLAVVTGRMRLDSVLVRTPTESFFLCYALPSFGSYLTVLAVVCNTAYTSNLLGLLVYFIVSAVGYCSGKGAAFHAIDDT